MALPPIPGTIAQYFQAAAKATGLPESVVAAQNYTESGYGTNLGPSSAGAEGPWQFLPSTYTGLGFNVATINQWGPSTQAYEKYMQQLLHTEGGNVRNALAAYNAGPGNLQAGYGYADHILALANSSKNLQVGTPNQPQQTSPDQTAGGLLSWPGDITGFFHDAKDFMDALLWIVNPASWLRIGSFAMGILLILAAIWLFIKVGSDEPIIGKGPTIPLPVPV
jgi:Transglycosylase SLT domain